MSALDQPPQQLQPSQASHRITLKMPPKYLKGMNPPTTYLDKDGRLKIELYDDDDRNDNCRPKAVLHADHRAIDRAGIKPPDPPIEKGLEAHLPHLPNVLRLEAHGDGMELVLRIAHGAMEVVLHHLSEEELHDVILAAKSCGAMKLLWPSAKAWAERLPPIDLYQCRAQIAYQIGDDRLYTECAECLTLAFHFRGSVAMQKKGEMFCDLEGPLSGVGWERKSSSFF
jgi:hypothetical protein